MAMAGVCNWVEGAGVVDSWQRSREGSHKAGVEGAAEQSGECVARVREAPGEVAMSE